MNRLTEREQRKMERRFVLQRRAVELLGIISAEFKSDPMSVQCFDLRIVRESIEVSAELDTLMESFL